MAIIIIFRKWNHPYLSCAYSSDLPKLLTTSIWTFNSMSKPKIECKLDPNSNKSWELPLPKIPEPKAHLTKIKLLLVLRLKSRVSPWADQPLDNSCKWTWETLCYPEGALKETVMLTSGTTHGQDLFFQEASLFLIQTQLHPLTLTMLL